MLTITVNDSHHQVPPGTTVADLLVILGLKTRFLAVELNRHVIPRCDHGRTTLSDGDTLEIVTLVGGG